jgi:membrane protease YdiL (CAAX protease family)
MLETLVTKISIVLIVLILLVIINGRRLWGYKAHIGLFFLAFFADNLLIVLTNAYPSLQAIPSHLWEGFLVCNWSGKLYSILFTLALIYVTLRIVSLVDVGLTLRQNKGSILPSWLVILVLAAWSTVIGIRSPKGRFDLEALIYLAIMPGLNEELVYRGYLLGLLNKFMPKRVNIFGAWMGWGALATSLLFALLHGFQFQGNLSLHLDIIALENSFISGLIFTWLRERTGSLVMPVIAHGLEDFLFFLPRMV